MKTRWSQNFLIDKNIARLCVDNLHLVEGDSVIEIGPGKGVLTDLLLQNQISLTAVEIDPVICSKLEKRYASLNNFTLIGDDFLTVDPNRLEMNHHPKIKVIGNLPYAVVSPIIQKIISLRHWSRAVLMVQKEVGERMCTPPNSRNYGILTLSIQSRCRCRNLFPVSRFCYKPAPKVESMVLELEPLEHPVIEPIEEESFFKVVKASFSHRRKTVLNSLSRSLKLPTDQVRNALESCGLSPQSRAENFTVEDYKKLSEKIKTLQS